MPQKWLSKQNLFYFFTILAILLFIGAVVWAVAGSMEHFVPTPTAREQYDDILADKRDSCKTC